MTTTTTKIHKCDPYLCETCVKTWEVMDTDGIYVSPVTATSLKIAEADVTAKGYEVLDVQDNMIIIAPGA